MKKLFLFLIMMGYIIPSISLAQQPISEISISPFLQELEVEKGGVIKSSITVTNSSDTDLQVSISTKDFLPGDRGEPLFVPDAEFNEATFSLASWVNIPQGNTVTIPANSNKEIVYSVNPPPNAEQGTHYGAIMFSYNGDKNLAGVGITQSVGSIILVSYGQARSQGDNTFSVDHKLEFVNNKFYFTNIFSNTGNVHVKPKGEIVIKNIFGQTTATSYMNRDGDNVLPQSDRTFLSEWTPGTFSFGPYRAELLVTYGRERLEIQAQQTIWVFPIYFIILIVLVLTAVIWFMLHGRHWHKRRVLQKHLDNNQ